MIPKIEDLLIEGLERRITEALPETSASSDGDEPETFVTTFETRSFNPCIQEQENLTVYGEVTAEISVILYSQRTRYDYTALYISFAKDPYIRLAPGVSAVIGLEKCEAVEGPYLSNDAWLFKTRYFVFEVDDAQEWQQPRLGNTGKSAPEIYPRPEPDTRHEPEEHI